MPRVCVLAIAMVTTTIAHGQRPGPAARVPVAYRDAVAAYRRGDVESATDALSTWSREDLKRAISALNDGRDDWQLAGAAAMLHTEIVLSGKTTAKATISMHLALARALVDNLRPAGGPARQPLPDGVLAFQLRWYALAGSIYLASSDPNTGSVFIDRGLRLFKNDARLHTLSGEADEVRRNLADGNLHDLEAIRLMALTSARRALVFAEGSYRYALDLDPAYHEARLRLGRLLSLRNDLKGARVELEHVARSPAPARIRYLAHLFLGAVAEYQSLLADARREYSDALAIAPDCQTPYVALTFVEQAMGHADAAHELMARYAALSKDAAADPWWDYQNGGLDAESLVWLRRQVIE